MDYCFFLSFFFLSFFSFFVETKGCVALGLSCDAVFTRKGWEVNASKS